MAVLIGALFVLLALAAATGLSLRLLFPLPPLAPRRPSRTLKSGDESALGRGARKAAEGRGRLSGFRLLDDGREAFAARALLARKAERSLDVQCYIWRGDRSGTLLLEELREAADRGVRVRLLIDDNGTAGLDLALAALDRHPLIEARLFNPFVIRRPKAVGYLADFARLNRRMHNKCFIADQRAAIVGGRNIGDEYFGARDEGLFLDLDALAVGPIVDEAARDFDRYWASERAYPAAQILPPVPERALGALAAAASIAERDPTARAYVEAVRAIPIVDDLAAGRLDFEWAPARLVSDDPAKAMGVARARLLARALGRALRGRRRREPKSGAGAGAAPADQGRGAGYLSSRRARVETLFSALHDILGAPRRQVDLVSGYFVPTRAGVDALAAMARSGVRISVATNAFEATDVWLVHAGYAHWRKRLVAAGVRLYEMRGAPRAEGAPPRRRLIGAGSGGAPGGSGEALRSAGSTLHAKTFAVDGRRLFVGSFNFDPRSMRLNTELGVVIESEALARAVEEAFSTTIPERAYEVALGPRGRLEWRERRGGAVVVHAREPGARLWQRCGVALLSRLPIEWLL
ncbi:phospholipase D family protein [Methylocella sp.]|uniref:phospholipase D family protein n=1 Tax=Methylocella sp. TaxID=1978226 RepID=UPI0037851917